MLCCLVLSRVSCPKPPAGSGHTKKQAVYSCRRAVGVLRRDPAGRRVAGVSADSTRKRRTRNNLSDLYSSRENKKTELNFE